MRKMKSMKVVLAALFGLSFSWNVCAQQSDIKDQGYVHKSSTSYEYPTDPAVLQRSMARLEIRCTVPLGTLFRTGYFRVVAVVFGRKIYSAPN